MQVKNEGQTTAGPEGSITVKADRQWVRVVLSDIRYIEGWKEYVKIHTREETYVTLERMSKMEELLPDTFFLRVHKSFIIACNAVTKMDGDCLIIGQNRIPVSRSKKKEVLASLFLDGD
ncbi:MAG: LytTR family DNA-binding domain-containing protein [Saprospiraceae bacterium]